MAVKAKGAHVLVTTLKDFVKIEKDHRWPVPLMAVDVSLNLIRDDDQFRAILADALLVTDT